MDNSTFAPQKFAQRLRGLREAAGLSQKELATMLNYSRGSISYYENCDRVPDIVFLMAVSDFFDVDPRFLLGLSDHRSVANEDIGSRFGLSDKAIDILDSLKLSEYRYFISAFIEHDLFPKLFKCMELYDRYFLDSYTISLHTSLDELDFRHFQITRIIMTILDDLQKSDILCGRTVTALDHIDVETRTQFYDEMRERFDREFADTNRIIEELLSERKERMEKENRKIQEQYAEWEKTDQKEFNARIAAKSYVESVNSSEDES